MDRRLEPLALFRLLATSLVLAFSTTQFASAETARYQLTVDCTWGTATHPGAFPNAAHFSWFGGGTHSAAVEFWAEGTLASPGMVQMAETGVTTMLEGEVQSAVMAGTAGSVLGWHYWFCPPETTSSSCGSLVVEFDVTDDHPLVTLASMLGPSPDWFVGVSGLALHDGAGWIDSVTVALHPYDAGTRAQNVLQLFGPLTSPPDPITLISMASGQIIGPQSLGSMTFERIDSPFVRGDANDDGAFNLGDAIAILVALFQSGATVSCEDALDTNNDGALDLQDAIYGLSGLFANGPLPAAPFGACGDDPDSDLLSCVEFVSCP